MTKTTFSARPKTADYQRSLRRWIRYLKAFENKWQARIFTRTARLKRTGAAAQLPPGARAAFQTATC